MYNMYMYIIYVDTMYVSTYIEIYRNKGIITVFNCLVSSQCIFACACINSKISI